MIAFFIFSKANTILQKLKKCLNWNPDRNLGFDSGIDLTAHVQVRGTEDLDPAVAVQDDKPGDNLPVQDTLNLASVLNSGTHKHKFKDLYYLAVFRIRIRSDPYHLAGSGSASGNVDLDPGTKKNRDILAYKSTQIIKI